MPFLITIPKKYSCDGFDNYVLAKYINTVYNKLSRSSYTLSDKALREFLGESGGPTNLNSYALISYYIKTFGISKARDCTYIGDVKGNERVIDSKQKISECVRLIEYGTLTNPPVARITVVAQDIQSRIDSIYEEWQKKERR